MTEAERLKRLDEFTLADLEAVRLILRGDSVIDWHRLNFEDEAEIREFLLGAGVRAGTRRPTGLRMEHVKGEAIALPAPALRLSHPEAGRAGHGARAHACSRRAAATGRCAPARS